MSSSVVTYGASGVAILCAVDAIVNGLVAQVQADAPGAYVPPAGAYTGVGTGLLLGVAAIVTAAGPTLVQIYQQRVAERLARLNFGGRLTDLERDATHAREEAARAREEAAQARAEAERMRREADELRGKVDSNAARVGVNEAKSDAVVDALRRQGWLDPGDPPAPSTILSRPRPTLLIVEDNPDMAGLLVKLFTGSGFATTYAPTLALAEEALAKGPHWMILDLKLGDGDLTEDTDGMWLLRKVRRERLNTHVAVVTGTAVPERLAEARALSDAVFTKPIANFDDLVATLNRVSPPEPPSERPTGPAPSQPGGPDA